ncbi:hypothetical protein Tco_0968506 [Tanacetum coccineum]
MVAYLEKTEGNASFMSVIDFSCIEASIHNALLTPSPSTHIPDSIPESSGGNHGGQDQKLKRKPKPIITPPQSLDEECILEAKIGRKEVLEEKLDAKEVWTKEVVNEEKETADDEVSTEDVLSTTQQKVSTDKEKVSTDSTNVSTDRPKVSTDKEKDSIVRTDEVSREKEKGVELKDVEETERPRPTLTRSLLTLKPLPKIDPKDKGKKKIEEEEESKTKSEGIPEAEKKFKQLARDEEIARKLQEDWETEKERKRFS